MSDRQDLSPDPRAERASNAEKNDPHRGSLRITGLRILCVHNGVHPDGPACTRSATLASETGCASARLAKMAVKVTERRSFFMYASNASGGPRKRTRSARNAGARCETTGVFLLKSDKLRTCPCVKLHRLRPLSKSGISLVNVSFWHFSDLPAVPTNVRFQG
jgi:hypothetical protein